MPDSFDYTTGTNSENVRLLQALIDDAPEYTEETNSRNANILKSIINNTEYTDAPQSEIEELLLRLKAKIGGEIEVDELNVTENGTYDAGVNKAYNPVNVELPLDEKTITANGTYTASDDNLAGYDEVTVAVEGYAKKSIANTPTPIATFNASALPMPSLTVGIEATQDLHGYDNPWVGGAGKNKLPMTVEGIKAVNTYHSWSGNSTTINNVTITIETSNSGDVTGIRFNGTASADITFNLASNITIPNGSYVWSNDQIVNISNLWLSLTNPNRAITLSNEKERDVTVSNGSIDGAYIYASNGNVFNNVVFKPMIRLASVTDATFAPYSNICPISGWDEVNVAVSPTTDAEDGTTYTTALKDGQGNPMVCYGGTLDVVSGVLTVDRAEVDLGTLNWVYNENTNVFGSNQFTPYVLTNGKLTCSQYKWNSTPNISPSSLSDNEISASPYFNRNTVMVKDSRYTDPTEFKQAMSGVKLVYELATPQTIPQDNLAIATQDGTNNMWADSGDVLSGEYFVEL